MKHTKTQMCQRAREIKQNVGVVTNKDDFKFLSELFARHYYFQELSDYEFLSFEVRYNYVGQTEFLVTYCIGDKVIADAFSYMKAVDGRTGIEWAKKDVNDALRRTVSAGQYKYRFTYPRKSDISNEIIYSPKDAEVDHYDMDWKDLAQIWVDNHGGYIELSKYVESDENHFKYLNDVSLANDFRKFHDANTHLRIITKSENKARNRKL